MRVLDHLLKAVRDAAVFNPEVQVGIMIELPRKRHGAWMP